MTNSREFFVQQIPPQLVLGSRGRSSTHVNAQLQLRRGQVVPSTYSYGAAQANQHAIFYLLSDRARCATPYRPITAQTRSNPSEMHPGGNGDIAPSVLQDVSNL